MEFKQKVNKQAHYTSSTALESGLQNVHVPLSYIIYLYVYFS